MAQPRQAGGVCTRDLDGVYYAFDRYTSQILISVDAGANFKPIVSGLPKIEGWQSAELYVVPGLMRDLWLAMRNSLIHSKDSASNVVDMKDVDATYGVGFGAPQVKGGYPTIYLAGKVGGKDGLWRSSDEGANWVQINDDAHQFGRVRLITGDMRDPGIVYIAPDGRGVMVGRPPQ